MLKSNVGEGTWVRVHFLCSGKNTGVTQFGGHLDVHSIFITGIDTLARRRRMTMLLVFHLGISDVVHGRELMQPYDTDRSEKAWAILTFQLRYLRIFGTTSVV